MKKYAVRFEVIRSTATVVVAADSYEEAVARARTAPPIFKVVPVAVAECEDDAEFHAVVDKCNWCGFEIVAHDDSLTYRSDPDRRNGSICGGCAVGLPEE